MAVDCVLSLLAASMFVGSAPGRLIGVASYALAILFKSLSGIQSYMADPWRASMDELEPTESNEPNGRLLEVLGVSTW